MSLFLGKNNNGNNILHISNSVVSKPTLEGGTYLPGVTTFLSTQPLQYFTKVYSAVSSTTSYYDFSGSAVNDILNFEKIQIPGEYTAIGSSDRYLIIAKTRYGSYAIPYAPCVNLNSLYAVARLFTSVGIEEVFSVYNTSDGYYIAFPYGVTPNPIEYPYGTRSSIEIYKIGTIQGTTSGSIYIDGTNFIIGGVNLKALHFASFDTLNSKDTVYTLTKGDLATSIQLLNTANSNGIRLDNDEIVTTVDGVRCLLFGGNSRSHSILKSVTSYTKVLSINIGPISSKGFITVSNLYVYVPAEYTLYVKCPTVTFTTDMGYGGLLFYDTGSGAGILNYDPSTATITAIINNIDGYTMSCKLSCTIHVTH